jgi:hypothetical protein
LQSVARAIDGDARGATKSLERDFERHLAIAKDLLEGSARPSSDDRRRSRQDRQLHKIMLASRYQPAVAGRDCRLWRAVIVPVARGGAVRNGLGARYVDAGPV